MPTAKKAIRNEAVKARTGKGWKEWFSILDRWGAARKGHTLTAKHLRERHGVSSWWCQEVTVQYEKDRGLRKVGERTGRKGYETAVQRTLDVPVRSAYEAFTDSKALSRWFGKGSSARPKIKGPFRYGRHGRGTFLLCEAGKRIRLEWAGKRGASPTLVDITFTAKGRGRSVVRVSHEKISSRADHDDLKKRWTRAMDSLQSLCAP